MRAAARLLEPRATGALVKRRFLAPVHATLVKSEHETAGDVEDTYRQPFEPPDYDDQERVYVVHPNYPAPSRTAGQRESSRPPSTSTDATARARRETKHEDGTSDSPAPISSDARRNVSRRAVPVSPSQSARRQPASGRQAVARVRVKDEEEEEEKEEKEEEEACEAHEEREDKTKEDEEEEEGEDEHAEKEQETLADDWKAEQIGDVDETEGAVPEPDRSVETEEDPDAVSESLRVADEEEEEEKREDALYGDSGRGASRRRLSSLGRTSCKRKRIAAAREIGDAADEGETTDEEGDLVAFKEQQDAALFRSTHIARENAASRRGDDDADGGAEEDDVRHEEDGDAVSTSHAKKSTGGGGGGRGGGGGCGALEDIDFDTDLDLLSEAMGFDPRKKRKKKKSAEAARKGDGESKNQVDEDMSAILGLASSALSAPAAPKWCFSSGEHAYAALSSRPSGAYEVYLHVVTTHPSWQLTKGNQMTKYIANRVQAVLCVATVSVLRSDATRSASRQYRVYCNPAAFPEEAMARAFCLRDADRRRELTAEHPEETLDAQTLAEGAADLDPEFDIQRRVRTYGWMAELGMLLDDSSTIVAFNALEQFGVLRPLLRFAQRVDMWMQRTFDPTPEIKKAQNHFRGPSLGDMLMIQNLWRSHPLPNSFAAPNAFAAGEWSRLATIGLAHVDATLALVRIMANSSDHGMQVPNVKESDMRKRREKKEEARQAPSWPSDADDGLSSARSSASSWAGHQPPPPPPTARARIASAPVQPVWHSFEKSWHKYFDTQDASDSDGDDGDDGDGGEGEHAAMPALESGDAEVDADVDANADVKEDVDGEPAEGELATNAETLNVTEKEAEEGAEEVAEETAEETAEEVAEETAEETAEDRDTAAESVDVKAEEE